MHIAIILYIATLIRVRESREFDSIIIIIIIIIIEPYRAELCILTIFASFYIAIVQIILCVCQNDSIDPNNMHSLLQYMTALLEYYEQPIILSV